MNQPDDIGILGWLVEHLWAPTLALVGVVWKQNQSAMSGHAATAAAALDSHAKDDDAKFKAVHEEQNVQRGHIAKLFDKLEESGKRSEDRHREFMQALHDKHTEMLNALHAGLRSKADK